MVMNFELSLNATSVIITSIIILHWSKCLFHLYISHLERNVLVSSDYSKLKYIQNYYTEKDFRDYQYEARILLIYNIYEHFYGAVLLVGIIILEVFELLWRLTKRWRNKFRIQNESRIPSLYVTLIRTFFLIVNFPINLLKSIVTKQKFGAFILWHFLDYIRDVVIFAILAYVLHRAIKYFKRNVISAIWAVVAAFFLIQTLINMDFFTSMEPLEEGTLREDLNTVLFELEYPTNHVFHVEDEVNDKVYFIDTWLRKAMVITGPLPSDKPLSLFNDSSQGIQFTKNEIIALVIFKVTDWVKGRKYFSLMLTQVHLLVLSITCLHLYRRGFFYDVGGFRKEKPPIANLILVLYFVAIPYWQVFYSLWKNIYGFSQITEAQLICSRMLYGQDLLTSLVKVYRLNRQFPNHDYWYNIFTGERRPLTTLALTLQFPGY